ncbi:hypothetical protein AMELA_G00151060 [Ameiurus melas]|uniref:Uncharacterized protein n=1 Tax=Ameiurus melas TaxID=219545 RepID=A0A7J6AHU1_AMEME|nr:hypothetical protein AMELA_G00151060 [Ameiurus melas]
METVQALTIVQEAQVPRYRLPVISEHYLAENGRGKSRPQLSSSEPPLEQERNLPLAIHALLKRRKEGFKSPSTKVNDWITITCQSPEWAADNTRSDYWITFQHFPPHFHNTLFFSPARQI